MALGGTLYFVGSFLPFLSLDLRDICLAFSAELPIDCLQEIPDETLTAWGWNSPFIAVSALLMLAAVVLMAFRCWDRCAPQPASITRSPAWSGSRPCSP